VGFQPPLAHTAACPEKRMTRRGQIHARFLEECGKQPAQIQSGTNTLAAVGKDGFQCFTAQHAGELLNERNFESRSPLLMFIGNSRVQVY
jgi:hypothetical protein